MLPSDLLIYRQNGETVTPKRLPLDPSARSIAQELITCLQQHLHQPQGKLDEVLAEIEGDKPDFKLWRGLAHILKTSYATFEVVSPLEPQLLRQRVFTAASLVTPSPQGAIAVLENLATTLSEELQRPVFPPEISQGLYADLPANRLLTEFTAPTPDQLIHRYNLSQVQGIFYKASEIKIHAHRNDPGEYKLLFRYLKLFRLMAYIEGDADHGFTITIDGPTSLFKETRRYGIDFAKLIPALLHVTKWDLTATLQWKDDFTKKLRKGRFILNDRCGLVTHYPPGKPYDSMLEASFADNWSKLKTDWQLEREVDLIPIPGSVMIPDFRLVHPDGRSYLLEIVGYWRSTYLQKKFAQVRKAECSNLILAISERLNLEKAGIKIDQVPAKIIWFKDKLSPKEVLKILD